MLRSPHLVIKSCLILIFWVLFLSLMPGCSVTDFIGAYFNTFYNAQRQFGEAEDEILNQRENKQADKPFGYVFQVQSTTKAKLTAVIEKCSKLLQYHPESNLVDDALLMIGKSYYYQNENQQAERKFKELLDQFPNSDLANETKLLLGYTYYMMSDQAKSSSVAKELVDEATKSGDNDYVAKASVLLAQLEIDNKNIDPAKAYYQTAAEKAGTSDERCTAYLNLAGLHSQGENYQRALDAYRKAESASSNYVHSYKSRIGQARMLSRLGAFEESLDLLKELLGSSNFREFAGEINLEIGNALKESKDYHGAIAQYAYVDTAYARTDASANSYFQLGDLFETKLKVLDSAFVCYSKGKSEFPQATITPQLMRRSEYLGKYLQYRNEIKKYDSIKSALLAPPDTNNVVKAEVDSTLDSLQTKQDSTITKAPTSPPMSMDTVNARLAYNKVELAALFYTTMGLPDSAEKWFSRVLIDHPSSPNVPRALFTLAQIYGQDTTAPRSRGDSLYKEIALRYPESEFAPEAERQLGMPPRTKSLDPVEASYSRAEKLLNAGNPQAAGDTLRAIVKTYPSSVTASKAQYALGWIYERVNFQPDSAAASYRRLVSLYPGSQYASLVRLKLDEYDQSKKAPDTTKIDSLQVKDPSLLKDPAKQPPKGKQSRPDDPEEELAPPKKED